MQLVVITNTALKEELLSNGSDPDAAVIWIEDITQLNRVSSAEVVIDLLFEPAHLDSLKSLTEALVIINSVDRTLPETDERFVRINGWPTLLQSTAVEASCLREDLKEKISAIFSLFHKKIEWLPDTIGFVTPRVISMIINEAFIALKEGVSTAEEINTAMKLGTNYPYGPFDWAARIGIQRVNALLQKLSQSKEPYHSFVADDSTN